MTTSLQDVVDVLGHAKTLYGAGSALLTLVLAKFTAPFQDDMPFPLKLVLVVLAIAEIFVIQDLRRSLGAGYLIACLATLSLIFMLLYLWVFHKFSYSKIVEAPKRRWFGSKLAYKEVQVLGGYRLTPAAASGGDVQAFFQDSAYEQDRVWTRGSRFVVQALAVMSYILAVLAFIGILGVVAGA